MIELLCGVCIFILLIGTITDFKVREVPDWLNYSGIAAGLGIRLIWSLYSFEWSYILEGLLGFGVFLGIAFAMFYLGQWGGGDSKVLMALGALLGLRFDASHIAVAFLVNAVVVGGFYGVLWSLGLAIFNWKKFRKEFHKLRVHKSFARVKIILVAFVILLLAASFIVKDPLLKPAMIVFGILAIMMYYIILVIKSVEQCCMYKYVTPQELTEGDWIVNDIKIKGKRICGPKDLGIEKKQINQLIKANVKKVLIKIGIPFVPSFLIAFILALWIGNWLVWLV